MFQNQLVEIRAPQFAGLLITVSTRPASPSGRCRVNFRLRRLLPVQISGETKVDAHEPRQCDGERPAPLASYTPSPPHAKGVGET